MNKALIFLTIVIIALGLIVGYVVSEIGKPDPGLARNNADRVLHDGSAKSISANQQGVDDQPLNQNTMTTSINETITTTLKTSKGDIKIELYGETFPNTVSNFVNLARNNFYDGLIFHRVIEGFMIQGGDPTGTGRGGPGYAFDDELKPESDAAQRGYRRGTVAMANSGPDTNGSQFFIMHRDQDLPYRYTIFGRVTEGMDVVDVIAAAKTGPGDKPLNDITIEGVGLER